MLVLFYCALFVSKYFLIPCLPKYLVSFLNLRFKFHVTDATLAVMLPQNTYLLNYFVKAILLTLVKSIGQITPTDTVKYAEYDIVQNSKVKKIYFL